MSPLKAARAACLACFLVVSSGCGEAPTRVLVVVDAQPQVRAQSRSLRLQVRKPAAVVDGVAVWEPSREYDSVEPSLGRGAGNVPRYPFTVLLEQRSASPFYELRVAALDGSGLALVEQGLRGRFVEGETRLVRLTLVDGCLGVSCSDPDRVCGCPDGSGDALNCRQPLGCVAASDVGDGDAYDPSDVYACDGGSCRVLAPEGGMEAGATPMEGGTDSGGMDSGGMDAGMDAGAPPPPPGRTCSDGFLGPSVPCVQAPTRCTMSMGSALPDCATPSSPCKRPVCGEGREEEAAAYDPCDAGSGSSASWCAPDRSVMPRCSVASAPPDAEAGWPAVDDTMPGVGPQFGSVVAVAGDWVAVSELPPPPPPGMGGGGPSGPPIERVVIFRIVDGGDGPPSLEEKARIGPAENPQTLSPIGGDVPSSVLGFGASLAMAQDGGDVWLAVGAPRSGGFVVGAVFLYRWPAAVSSIASPLRPVRVIGTPLADEVRHAGAAFGASLAMREQSRKLHLLVGMPQSPQTGRGAVFLYELSSSAGGSGASTVSIDPKLQWLGGTEMGARFFGSAVAMDATRLYAAGFMADGEAGVAVLAPDGSTGWQDDSGGSDAMRTRLCADRRNRSFYPPLGLSADEGVLALVQGYASRGGTSTLYKGAVDLWERWATGGMDGWYGPRRFGPRLDPSSSGLDHIMSVSVAGGRLVVGGQSQDGGSFNQPRYTTFLQRSPMGRWARQDDVAVVGEMGVGSAPSPGRVSSVAQRAGDPRRTLLVGVVVSASVPTGFGAVRLVRTAN